MQESMVLALDFLDEHPEAAVRTLEQHDAAQVADFLLKVPEAHAVVVLRECLPSFAARICRVLEAEVAARLLLEQSVTRMVAVLRHLEHPVVEAILRECPQSRRHTCRLLMRYGQDRVGAWMVPNTAVVEQGFSCGEVLSYLRDATEETASKFVFIVNREGVPTGRISYLRLLKAEAGIMVGNIMESPIPTLSAQLALGQAERLPFWDEVDVLPVVGAQHQFVGVLRHVDLRRGLHQDKGRSQGEITMADPLMGMVDVYGKSLLALFDTLGKVGREPRSLGASEKGTSR